MHDKKATLRRNISSRANDVWDYRDNTDAYTLQSRDVVRKLNPQVDHILEISVIEHAFERVCVSQGARNAWLKWQDVKSTKDNNAHPSFSLMQCVEGVTDILNCNCNLNVTSARVNQKKKGPFISANNRLRLDTLRSVTLEDLARRGKAKELIDDGTWARIEKCVQKQCDYFHDTVETMSDVHHESRKLLEGVNEEVQRFAELLKTDS